jgi:hypothetical protein
LKKKIETEPKPGQTDRFRFGFFRAKTGSNRFGSVFSGFGSVFFGLAWFFRFGSVLARFFFRFFVGFGSVRFFQFFQCFVYKTETEPNRLVFSKI